MPIELNGIHKAVSILFPDRDIVEVAISEKVTPEYDTTYVYGRSVPIVSFKNTKRTISVSFTHRLVSVLENYNKMISFMFPVNESFYNSVASLYTRTPIFKLTINNIFDGYGVINSFSATPDYGTLAKHNDKFYFTEVKYSFEFVPLNNDRASFGTSVYKENDITIPTATTIDGVPITQPKNYVKDAKERSKSLSLRTDEQQKEIDRINQEIVRINDAISAVSNTQAISSTSDDLPITAAPVSDPDEITRLQQQLQQTEQSLIELQATYQKSQQEAKAAQQAAEDLEKGIYSGGGATIITVPPRLTPSNGGNSGGTSGGC